MLTKGENVYYGTHRCSSCGKVLIGRCMTVGDDDSDKEGYYWRAFCKECQPGMDQLSCEEIIYIQGPAKGV